MHASGNGPAGASPEPTVVVVSSPGTVVTFPACHCNAAGPLLISGET